MSGNGINFGDYISDLNIKDAVIVGDGSASKRQCYVVYEADSGAVVEVWDTMLGAIIRVAELNNEDGAGAYEFEPSPYYSRLD